MPPLWRTELPADTPLAGLKKRFAFKSIQISVATALLRSPGSLSFQLFEPSTRAMPAVNIKSMEELAINRRGGNDLLSGMFAGSSTLTVGMSLASCTLVRLYY